MPGTTLTTAAGMRAIIGALTAAGLDASLKEQRCIRYIVATAPAGGGSGGDQALEITVEDDGYVQLTWWNPAQAAAPSRAAATIVNAVAVISRDGGLRAPRADQVIGGPSTSQR